MTAMNGVSRSRIALGAVGFAGIAYGTILLFAKSQVNRPFEVIKWAIGSDIIVDGILIPFVILIGWLLTVAVRPRARRYVQGALVAMGMVTLIAIPLIYRRNDSAPGQALLLQNYAANLAVLLALIAASAVVAYAAKIMRDHRSSATNVRPSDDQTSATE